MAGLGFKDFQVGEVLTAADVDGYLMQQSVMRFADAGARGSALGTATGTAVPLAEGMVSYLDDINQVEFYSGSGWVPVGGVRQVVSGSRTTDFSTTSTSYVTVTDVTATVTPTSVASRFLVMVSSFLYGSNATTGAGYQMIVARDGTQISGDPFVQYQPLNGGVRAQIGVSAAVLDAPATLSAVTYDLRLKAEATTTATAAYRSSIVVIELTS